MAGQANRLQLAEVEFNHAGEIFFGGGSQDVRVGGAPCGNPDCSCCQWWVGTAGLLLDVVYRSLNLSSILAGQAAATGEAAGRLREERDTLAGDNERLSRANRDLNAEKNNIKRTGTVPGKDRTSSGRKGRRPGCSPTINRRPSRIDRKETADVTACPKGHRLSGRVSCSYTRVVKVTRVLIENVEYTINRRWCPVCKKLISARPPGVSRHARRSANHPAILTFLHAAGLSHGKAAEFSCDALKFPVSRYTSYRDKMSYGRRLTPERDRITKDVLDEPSLNCDELWWPVSGSNAGAVMVALGDKACLAMVVKSATIERVREMRPGHQGIVTQDSKTTWLHAGSCHQMCMWHQHRLCKRDLKYRNLEGDALRFVSVLYRINLNHYRADKISDQHTREVAARCLDRQRSDLINHPWDAEGYPTVEGYPAVDDGSGPDEDSRKTTNRYVKRHRREGYFYTTHLYLQGIAPDNNAVERVNRKFVAIRSDGGGNRSADGMEANSVLFTIMATDRINGASFFDHLVRASSGDG